MDTKTIVITGSTRGIGLGMAHEFLKLGHHVVINGTTNESVSKAKITLETYNEQLLAVPGNILNPETVVEIYNQTFKRFGPVDVWINNAGIGQPYSYLWEIEDNSIQHVLDVNLKGVIISTKFVVSKMLEEGHGKIFNLEGLGSDGRIQNKMILYGTTKRGIRYFSKALAKELQALPVQIGVISPGMVFTDLLLNPVHTASSDDRARMNKIFSILAEPVEKVTPILAKRILKSNKSYNSIQYLTLWKAMLKFLSYPFRQTKQK